MGGTVVWWGISSCTSDEKVAKGFAHGCGGKATVITVESKTASDISQAKIPALDDVWMILYDFMTILWYSRENMLVY